MAGGEVQWHLREPVEGNPVVFMDVALGGLPAGRVKAELFADLCPRTAENFRQFCTGEFRPAQVPVGYKGAPFHRVIKGFMIQGGDPNTKDPAKGVETWGQGGPEYKIEPETGDLVHAQYVLSAAKGNEPQSSGSQFFITTGTPHHLDGIHTVFGAVIEGHAAVDELNSVSIRPTQGQQRDVPEAPVPAITSARVR